MIDIVTVGAGGGSIAWVSPEGALKVGPRSAGADPGPLCYGRGGTEPTLTDAALVLGRIPPHLLGGEIPLDVDAARAGVERAGRRARPRPRGVRGGRPGDLGLEPGQRHPPGDRAAGHRRPRLRPVRLRRLGPAAGRAGCSTSSASPAALVPPDPGNLCAFGLLTVDVRIDDVRTFVAAPRRASTSAALGRRVRASCEAEAAAALSAEGFDADDQRFLRSADLRYDGQAFEVRVDVPGRPGRRGRWPPPCWPGFHDEHERLYGYCYRDAPATASSGSTCGSPASGRSARPTLAPVRPGTGAVAPDRRPPGVVRRAPGTTRPVV